MSHMEQATLENSQICISMLDDAQARLRTLIADTEAIRKNSSTVIDEVIDRRIDSLLANARRMMGSIDDRRETVRGAQYAAAISATMDFLSTTNSVYLQSESLNRAVKEAFNKKMSEASVPHKGLDEYLEKIDDPELRSVMLLLSKNKTNNSLSLDELRELSESILDPSKKVKRRLVEDVVTDIESDMKTEKMSSDAVEKVIGNEEAVSPLEMKDRATKEIFDERLRRSAIQAIVKSISAKDFIINRSDIRHIKDGDVDQVKITARKPAGQTAEFLIDLNGKFVYHFEGYEGKACEKDIGPMEKDLEEIYGIKLTNRKTLWENPDKMQQRSYHDNNTMRGH